ncbi:ABSCISIC ACID-INSENSITIVE 5-like protein 2 [Mangifera indica]|uniref:ABSCISIC ACID-INSENSITIVE 5-like protein 2 n=1 Tax=Mangifera indica TaxID=29780 RepID=UPI001CFAF6A9|nr:ABSCISIC ACID-INSENSITIVE 5-like protein 2 [Mangifera indica]XP_044507030.1 ABSCISIC ACID-INSENSITIVE 5-like protein 2 [Mangifera indica]
MGAHTMGSEGVAAQGAKLQSLTRQGSLYSLTLNEIQTQLGDMGKPLGSMNLDELLKSVGTAEANPVRETTIDNVCGVAPGSLLHRQGSLTLSRNLSKKTVDEVWKDINQKSENYQERKAQERQATLGEITLEDFLIKAGVAAESIDTVEKNAGYICEIDHRQNIAQNGQWMQYQLPSAQPQPHQNLTAVLVPNHPMQQSLPVIANPNSDAVYPESQVTMSPSALIGTLSDTQATGRKRVAAGDVAEKTVERKQKRMIKNRESAARSRARKQAYTHELEIKVSQLEEENERLRKHRAAEFLQYAPPPEPKHQLRRTISAPF